MTAALRPALRSFAVPNYRRYFLGQLVSLSGTWMQVVAEMWLVLSLTHSGVAVGVAAALQFSPMLLVGAWGGLLADRFDKRRLLIVTQTAMALPALALLTLTATHAIALWMLYGRQLPLCVGLYSAVLSGFSREQLARAQVDFAVTKLSDPDAILEAVERALAWSEVE